VGLGRGPLSLVGTIEELLDRKSSGSGLGNRDYDSRGSAALTTWHPLSAKVGTNVIIINYYIPTNDVLEVDCAFKVC
jgi:hypothetical protein